MGEAVGLRNEWAVSIISLVLFFFGAQWYPTTSERSGFERYRRDGSL